MVRKDLIPGWYRGREVMCVMMKSHNRYFVGLDNIILYDFQKVADRFRCMLTWIFQVFSFDRMEVVDVIWRAQLLVLMHTLPVAIVLSSSTFWAPINCSFGAPHVDFTVHDILILLPCQIIQFRAFCWFPSKASIKMIGSGVSFRKFFCKHSISLYSKIRFHCNI